MKSFLSVTVFSAVLFFMVLFASSCKTQRTATSNLVTDSASVTSEEVSKQNSWSLESLTSDVAFSIDSIVIEEYSRPCAEPDTMLPQLHATWRRTVIHGVELQKSDEQHIERADSVSHRLSSDSIRNIVISSTTEKSTKKVMNHLWIIILGCVGALILVWLWQKKN